MTFTSVAAALRQYAEQLTQLQAVVGQPGMATQAHGVQQFFSQNLWGIITQLQLPQGSSQWHAAVTEIHRHMRLLAVEVSFAQSAQQSHISQQRLGQIEQRLEQLQGFTQVLLGLLPNELPR
ncbi:MAG: heterocyst frequency control protein PatD [Cyanobacteria bacterium P01_H01_bin.26]